MALPSAHAVNGAIDIDGRFPYVIQLLRGGKYTCTAVVVSSGIVATAAHCVQALDRAGDVELRYRAFDGGYRSRHAKQVIFPRSSTALLSRWWEGVETKNLKRPQPLRASVL